MSNERLWERLIEFLSEFGTATELEGGRTEVVLDSLRHGRERGEKGPARALQDAHRFLVYADYELVPSATPVLPVDPNEVRLNELARQHPEGIGEWWGVGRDGKRIE